MESRYIHARLTLSKFGDSIEIRIFNRNATEDDNIYPLLKKGLTCNGYDQVLDFLKKIQVNFECLQFVHLSHRNNANYPGHIFYPPKSNFHDESIENMIAFIEERKKNPAIPQKPYISRIGTQIVDAAIRSGCKII